MPELLRLGWSNFQRGHTLAVNNFLLSAVTSLIASVLCPILYRLLRWKWFSTLKCQIFIDRGSNYSRSLGVNFTADNKTRQTFNSQANFGTIDTHNKGEFTDAAEAKYTDIFEKYGKRGRHPYNEFITGKDYVFTQSDAIEQMLTMKISFRESARGGTRKKGSYSYSITATSFIDAVLCYFIEGACLTFGKVYFIRNYHLIHSHYKIPLTDESEFVWEMSVPFVVDLVLMLKTPTVTFFNVQGAVVQERLSIKTNKIISNPEEKNRFFCVFSVSFSEHPTKGYEYMKAGPLSTRAKCMKCEGRGTLVTSLCGFVSAIRLMTTTVTWFLAQTLKSIKSVNKVWWFSRKIK